jgi:hypothetical protein
MTLFLLLDGGVCAADLLQTVWGIGALPIQWGAVAKRWAGLVRQWYWVNFGSGLRSASIIAKEVQGWECALASLPVCGFVLQQKYLGKI